MRKLIGILIALCLLTAFVSTASAGGCKPGENCFDTKIKNVDNGLAKSTPIKLIVGASDSEAEAEAEAEGDCPQAYAETGAGQLETGTFAYGIAQADGYKAEAEAESESKAFSVFTANKKKY
ncbi:hypothetical protein SAMN02910340_02128 [Methanosarcina thermophila]|jgi:hypothetical protein|uniref:Modification methylase BsuRI n=3 Tax=Methanosarcina thermophila TaxID=2210 RepID=A0A1I7AI93_METTE|nr:hypothetical protein [Methanosarcina thermophila]ALK06014.1 MAG: hypothetical protein AAY43_10330 [Methanosarcina sp. 795]AKB12403.1 hypothetical protein MSTHT_0645 [Methanosarcina thermophila TM-1]AKB14393.1 hypothetical protein MSTHC_0075 [Methanosarcina thermophila CHTI-55]NLU58069.1 hypothetical protein [Methanosarcina thermophila]SFT74600.1 hypothetical protein SAMN02910340_02128 [Methanosarcina thermophila]